MNRRRSPMRRPARFNPVRMIKGLLLETLGFATLVALYFTLNGTTWSPAIESGQSPEAMTPVHSLPSISIAGMWSSAINLAGDSHSAGVPWSGRGARGAY